MARSCGNCGSTDIKAASAIAEQLSINTRATTVGIGFFGGGAGVGAAASRGNMSPELVKKIKMEVPHRAGFFSILLWIVLILVFLSIVASDASLNNNVLTDGGTFFLWCLGISFLTLIVKIVRIFTYPKRRRYYKSLWYCFSCGQFRIFKS